MNTKQKIKLYAVAAIIGAGLAFEISRQPGVVRVQAEDVPTPKITVTATPTLTQTPTPTPTEVPSYDVSRLISNYDLSGLQLQYARYIWDKWAGYGNRLQAVALCTNMSEGHLDDNAYNVNTDGSEDKGCWQWNSIHGYPDSVTKNCFEATDLTFKVFEKRMGLGILEGFSGMWYGYGSANFYRCLDIIN